MNASLLFAAATLALVLVASAGRQNPSSGPAPDSSLSINAGVEQERPVLQIVINGDLGGAELERHNQFLERSRAVPRRRLVDTFASGSIYSGRYLPAPSGPAQQPGIIRPLAGPQQEQLQSSYPNISELPDYVPAYARDDKN